MYANQIVETLNNMDKSEFKYPLSSIIQFLSSSVKFHLGEVSNATDALKHKYKGHELFYGDLDVPPPYPILLLTYSRQYDRASLAPLEMYSTKSAVMAVHIDSSSFDCDTLYFTFVYHNDESRWIISPMGFAGKRSSSELMPFCVIRENLLVERIGRKLTPDETINIVNGAGSIITNYNLFVMLLTCKNIIIENISSDDKLNRSRQKKGKLPIFDYKVLSVILPSARKSKRFNYEHTDIKQRIHLCRGHFKDYTSERPLFGKHVGRYWWQPIIRGQEKGFVAKEYHIEMPHDQYDDHNNRKC